MSDTNSKKRLLDGEESHSEEPGGDAVKRVKSSESEGVKPSLPLEETPLVGQHGDGQGGSEVSTKDAISLKVTSTEVTPTQVPTDVSATDDICRSSANSVENKMVGLCEKDVGIEIYLSDLQGFTGVIKQRYRDFVVNEISEETGKIVRLTDYSCPKEEKKIVDYSDVLSDEDKGALSDLMETKDKKSHLIEVSSDKAQRTRVHETIKQDFPKLESKTVDKNNKKYIQVSRMSNDGKSRMSRWPQHRPDFCKFVLYKENMNMTDALALIAKYLHMRPHIFQVAGTKDKRAVTVQEVSVYKVDADRLANLNNLLRNVRLGNFRYDTKGLKLGELTGNHFQIILRNVLGERVDMDAALTSLKDIGFINYFGMQRFGNSEVSTYQVGRAVLKNQWEEAVDLILKPREGDKSEDLVWRREWARSRDAKATLEKMSRHAQNGMMFYLLKDLLHRKNNYLQAFLQIPRNTRTLYIHSYQSYVWNRVATKRIQEFGLKVALGDLVYKKSADDEDASTVEPEVVTEENIHEYSLYDIIIPVPGHKIQYPSNGVGDWYKELLAADDLTLDHFKHKVKDFALPGAYRKLIVKPTDVFWKFIPYSDVTEHLIQTDKEKLEGIPPPNVIEDGTYLALHVGFSLPSSAYATMALREVMKVDTSVGFQTTLNV